MWDEIGIMTNRLNTLIEKAMHLERVANNAMDLAHDLAIEANIIKHEIEMLHRYEDDLK